MEAVKVVRQMLCLIPKEISTQVNQSNIKTSISNADIVLDIHRNSLIN